MDAPYNLETENDPDKTTSKTINHDDSDMHSVISASSSESSEDPVKYEVDSIASSVEERLTYVQTIGNNVHRMDNHILSLHFLKAHEMSSPHLDTIDTYIRLVMV